MSIAVRDLVKVYGTTRVVHGISFDVDAGEFVSLLGPSGCGKTTTLRCIAGLEEATGGLIRIGQQTVSDPANGIMLQPHDRNIGMVFQSYAIWPHMTVADNVGFPLTVRKVAPREVERQVDEALDIVGMRHLRARQPSQLSGGQQQRVALARAIVGRPRILLFDEPLSNLDAKLREGTRGEIRRLQRELGVATVYVTHDQEEALSMSSRVIVMDHGRIMQAGTPKDLYRRPDNRFVADFVGRASFIDVTAAPAACEWRTPDGSVVRVAEEPGERDRRYQLMLRPEALWFDAGDAAATEINTLHGRIVEGQYLGAHTEYEVEAAGARLKLYAAADLLPGSPVTIRFASADGRLVATQHQD